jgi:hypothetical protein
VRSSLYGTTRLAWLAGLTFAAGCRDGGGVDLGQPRAMASVARPAAPEPEARVAPAPAPKALPRPEKGHEVEVPAGTLRLGSPTGSVDRDPSREADAVAVEVPAFAIDALPHPNDPAAPFTSGVSRSEAERLCAADGKRLCSELEWERACKGDADAQYPAESFDAARCASQPLSCVSPLGVFALGTQAREWTRDTLQSGFVDSLRTAVVRGAPPDAEPRAHRCASRDAATADSKSATLTFRCCRGPAPELGYPSERELPAFEERKLDAAEVLASMSETAPVAEQFRAFSHDDYTRALATAGYSRAGLAPWQAAEKPLVWRPVRGEVVHVLAGDTPRGALLVAYYPLPDGKAQFIGSYETAGEHAAIVVAYKVDTPGELLFSTCWGCGGEGGAIQLGSDGRIHIVQR